MEFHKLVKNGKKTDLFLFSWKKGQEHHKLMGPHVQLLVFSSWNIFCNDTFCNYLTQTSKKLSKLTNNEEFMVKV